MCNDPFEPDFGLGLTDANIVTGIHEVKGAGDFVIYFPKPFKTAPVVTLTGHGKLGKAEACLIDKESDFGNVLKPDGKLGNALKFKWTSTPGVNGAGPNPNGRAASAQANTMRKYYQQGPGTNMWLAVELPTPVYCYSTALVGYPSSHEPTTSGGAYLDASNDGKSWTRLLSWSKHKGAGTAYLHTSYSGALNSKYYMTLPNKGPFKYYKTGARDFTK